MVGTADSILQCLRFWAATPAALCIGGLLARPRWARRPLDLRVLDALDGRLQLASTRTCRVADLACAAASRAAEFCDPKDVFIPRRSAILRAASGWTEPSAQPCVGIAPGSSAGLINACGKARRQEQPSRVLEAATCYITTANAKVGALWKQGDLFQARLRRLLLLAVVPQPLLSTRAPSFWRAASCCASRAVVHCASAGVMSVMKRARRGRRVEALAGEDAELTSACRHLPIPLASLGLAHLGKVLVVHVWPNRLRQLVGERPTALLRHHGLTYFHRGRTRARSRLHVGAVYAACARSKFTFSPTRLVRAAVRVSPSVASVHRPHSSSPSPAPVGT